MTTFGWRVSLLVFFVLSDLISGIQISVFDGLDAAIIPTRKAMALHKSDGNDTQVSQKCPTQTLRPKAQTDNDLTAFSPLQGYRLNSAARRHRDPVSITLPPLPSLLAVL